MPPQAPFQDVGPDQGFVSPDESGGFSPDADGLNLVHAMGAQALGGVQATAEANKPPEPPPDIEYKGDGTINIKNLSQMTAQHLQELISIGSQTKDILQQGIQQAMQKRAVLEQHPLIAQIGRTLSGVAANYNAPYSRNTAILRGIGAFGSDYFKDTPESLISRAAQLRAQQFGIEQAQLGQLEKIQAEQQTQARLDQAARHQATQEKQAALNERDRWEQNMDTLARQKLLPSQDSYTRSAITHGLTADEAATNYQNLVGIQQQKIKDEALLQGIKDKDEQKKFAQQLAMQSNLFGQQFKLENMREAARLQLANQTEMAKELKAKQVGPATEKTIADYDASLHQLDRVEDLIRKYPQFQGPIVGRVPSLAIGLGAKGSQAAAEELKFRTDLGNTVQAIVKAHGAGARGYNPTEFKLVIQPLTAAATRTQSQNLAAIQSAKDLVVEKAHALADTLEASQKDISRYGLFKRLGTTAPADVLPPAAKALLKEGFVQPFANGQEWTLTNGVPTRVK